MGVGAFVIGLSQISSFLSLLFVALFVLSLCPFDISVGVGAFVIGLSQISSFFFKKMFEHCYYFIMVYEASKYMIYYSLQCTL